MSDPDHPPADDTAAADRPSVETPSHVQDESEAAARRQEDAARRERAQKFARARELAEMRRARAALGQEVHDPSVEELQSLILSADAEAQVSREHGERGEGGPHVFRGVEGAGGRRLVVFGTEHVFDRSEVGDLRHTFEEASPDLVLREGTVEFPIDPALNDDEVLARYGEQVYLERVARKKGIEVKSWDVPWEEQLRMLVGEGHHPDAIIAWAMSQGTKHVLKQRRVLSRETLIDVLRVVLTPQVCEALQRDTGISFDPDQLDLDRIAQQELGRPIVDLDFDTAEQHANPWRRGRTNDVLRRMNELRDARAIALIAEAKRNGRNVFVLAGGDHVLAWQPALEALYPEHEFETLTQLHEAREILGERMVFGPEEVRATLGIELPPEQVPPIPYSREALERARERGEVLVLYVDHDAAGRPLTLQRMRELFEGRGPVLSEAGGSAQDAADLDMEFFTREAPRPGWRLVKIGEVPDTRHLSYEAQDAFVRRDSPTLRRALAEIPVMWGRAGIPREQQPTLPTPEELEQAMDALPSGAELPSAVEVVYQYLLRRAGGGERILSDMAVATRSRVQELPEIGEPERPIDIGLSGDDGISFHWRRSTRFGRPGTTKPGAIPGIPIGVIQH